MNESGAGFPLFRMLRGLKSSKSDNSEVLIQSLLSSEFSSETLKAIRKIKSALKTSENEESDKQITEIFIGLLPDILDNFSRVSNCDERQIGEKILERLYSKRDSFEDLNSSPSMPEATIDLGSIDKFIYRNLCLLNLSSKFSVEQFVAEIHSRFETRSVDYSNSLAIRMRLLALKEIHKRKQDELRANHPVLKIQESTFENFLLYLMNKRNLNISKDCLDLTREYGTLLGCNIQHSEKTIEQILRILEQAIDNSSLSVCINEADRFLDRELKLIYESQVEQNGTAVLTTKSIDQPEANRDLEILKLLKNTFSSSFKRISDVNRCIKWRYRLLLSAAVIGFGVAISTGISLLIQADSSDDKKYISLDPEFLAISASDTWNHDDGRDPIKVEATWSGVGEDFNDSEVTLAVNSALAESGIEVGDEVRLTNLANQRTTIARVNGRSQGSPHEVIVSEGAAEELNMIIKGVAKLRLEEIVQTGSKFSSVGAD